MRNAQRCGWMVVGVLFALAIGAHQPTGAQFSGMGGGFGPPPEEKSSVEPAARVHVPLPMSAPAFALHQALERPVAMPFQNETPLEDVLDYVRQATAEGEGAIEGGVTIYVDEIGLQEAEQSLQSPVKLNLKGLPLKTTLSLALKQVGLVYQVQPEGYLYITADGSEPGVIDPMLLILDELRALWAEVDALKNAQAAN